MKKLISAIAICAATTSAYAAPQLVRRTHGNAYNVTYDYTDKAKTGWYVAGRADLSFLNFKNKYTSNLPDLEGTSESESFSFESVFGGDLSFGHRFGYFVRGDIELGYVGNFTDKDDSVEYNLYIPYLMANVYYDFLSGFYVGAGVGAAMPTMELDGGIDEIKFSDTGNRRKRAFGVIGGINLGYAHKLDDNLVLDLRYRLAGISGVKHTRQITYNETVYDVNVKTGLIMDNSISLGIRYEF